MIENVKELFLYAASIIGDGIQRYLPRIAYGWWLVSLLVIDVTIVFNWNRVTKRETGISNAVGNVFTVGYFLSVIVITFGTRLPDQHIQYQLIPLLSYQQAMYGDPNEQFHILCNILLFVPFGVICPFLRHGKRKDTLLGVIQYAFCFTFCIEFLQLITRIGCFEIDDIINNVLGAVIGYLLFGLFRSKL